MNIAGNFENAQQEMLHEAGFQPCYVRDLGEGDTIAIDHAINRDAPTEMVVTSLWKTPGGEGNVISHWIGVLSNGRMTHCSYGSAFPVWRHVKAGA
jgi:hypothetical protein